MQRSLLQAGLLIKLSAVFCLANPWTPLRPCFYCNYGKWKKPLAHVVISWNLMTTTSMALFYDSGHACGLTANGRTKALLDSWSHQPKWPTWFSSPFWINLWCHWQRVIALWLSASSLLDCNICDLLNWLAKYFLICLSLMYLFL